MLIAKSLALFVVAGLCEIGGGYLVWRWWRDGAPLRLGMAGALVLVLYGIVPTYQPANFGRVYAAYGGVFVLLSILWGASIRPRQRIVSMLQPVCFDRASMPRLADGVVMARESLQKTLESVVTTDRTVVPWASSDQHRRVGWSPPSRT